MGVRIVSDTQDQNLAGGNISITTEPASLAAGELLLFYGVNLDAPTVTIPSVPTGFANIASVNGATVRGARAAYRVADGTEAPNYDSTIAGASSGSLGTLLRVTGAKQTSPIHNSTTKSGSEATTAMPSVAATVDCLAIAYVEGDEAFSTTPAGWTTSYTTTTGAGTFWYKTVAAGGSSGTATFDWAVTADYVIIVVLVALATTPVVAQYGNDANGFDLVMASGASKTVTGLAWSTGDIVVAVAIISSNDNANSWFPAVNGNLTFTALGPASTSGGAGTDSQIDAWFAIAGSSQSGQTVSFPLSTNNVGGKECGAAVWIITGSPASCIGVRDVTESSRTFVPVAGSVVINIYSDAAGVAAGRTQLTATGTLNERFDTAVTDATIWAGDWTGVTAAASAYGVDTYAGTAISQFFIEVLPTVATPGNIDFTSGVSDWWTMLGLEFTAVPTAPPTPPVLRAPIRSALRLR